MTTGATSKLTKKLLAKGFLVRYQKEKNRKEVYFRLTEEGERIYTTVSGLRQSLRRRDVPFFETMADEEYNTILQFAQRYDDYLRRNLEEIHHGGEAMADRNQEERERTRRNLLKYCDLDAYAMAKVWEKLCEAAQAKQYEEKTL